MCVRVKNHTLREVIGIGERGSSRVKEHFRRGARRTMDALDFHLVKRDSMGEEEGRGLVSIEISAVFFSLSLSRTTSRARITDGYRYQIIIDYLDSREEIVRTIFTDKEG